MVRRFSTLLFWERKMSKTGISEEEKKRRDEEIMALYAPKKRKGEDEVNEPDDLGSCLSGTSSRTPVSGGGW